MATKITYDLSSVLQQINQLKQAVGGVAFKDNLASEFSKNLKGITEQSIKIAGMYENGFKTSGDVKKLEAAFTKIGGSVSNFQIKMQDAMLDAKNFKLSPEATKQFQELANQARIAKENLDHMQSATGIKAKMNTNQNFTKLAKSDQQVLLDNMGNTKAFKAEVNKVSTNAENKLDTNMQASLLASRKEILDLQKQYNTELTKTKTKQEQLVLSDKTASTNKVKQAIPVIDSLKQAYREQSASSLPGIKEQTAAEEKRARALDNLRNRIGYIFGLANAYMYLRRFVQMAMRTIKELDAAFVEIAVVTNKTTSELWKSFSTYNTLAQQLGTTTKDAIKTSALYYQQGLQTKDVMSLTVETMKMARIAGMEYGEATDRMTAALRGFKLEMSEASRVNDVFSALAAKSAVDTDELSYALTKAASIANSAGMSLETTSAFLSKMIETTREAPENIGTALKTIIARFQELKKPLTDTEKEGMGINAEDLIDANKVDAALKTVGISVRDSATGQFKDLDGVFLELNKKWDSLDRNTQRYIATMAAGSRQQSRFLAMMDNYKRTIELVSIAENSQGASAIQFAKTLDSVQARTNQIKASFEELIGTLIKNEGVKSILTIINNIIGAFNKISKYGSLATLIFGLGFLNIVKGAVNSIVGFFEIINQRVMTLKKAIQERLTVNVTAKVEDKTLGNLNAQQAALLPGIAKTKQARILNGELQAVPDPTQKHLAFRQNNGELLRQSNGQIARDSNVINPFYNKDLTENQKKNISTSQLERLGTMPKEQQDKFLNKLDKTLADSNKTQNQIFKSNQKELRKIDKENYKIENKGNTKLAGAMSSYGLSITMAANALSMVATTIFASKGSAALAGSTMGGTIGSVVGMGIGAALTPILGPMGPMIVSSITQLAGTILGGIWGESSDTKKYGVGSEEEIKSREKILKSITEKNKQDVEELNQAQELKAEYIDLAKSTDLTNESKARLLEIEEALVKIYPELGAGLVNQSENYAIQIKVLEDLIKKKQDLADLETIKTGIAQTAVDFSKTYRANLIEAETLVKEQVGWWDSGIKSFFHQNILGRSKYMEQARDMASITNKETMNNALESVQKHAALIEGEAPEIAEAILNVANEISDNFDLNQEKLKDTAKNLVGFIETQISSQVKDEGLEDSFAINNIGLIKKVIADNFSEEIILEEIQKIYADNPNSAKAASAVESYVNKITEDRKSLTSELVNELNLLGKPQQEALTSSISSLSLTGENQNLRDKIVEEIKEISPGLAKYFTEPIINEMQNPDLFVKYADALSKLVGEGVDALPERQAFINLSLQLGDLDGEQAKNFTDSFTKLREQINSLDNVDQKLKAFEILQNVDVSNLSSISTLIYKLRTETDLTEEQIREFTNSLGDIGDKAGADATSAIELITASLTDLKTTLDIIEKSIDGKLDFSDISSFINLLDNADLANFDVTGTADGLRIVGDGLDMVDKQMKAFTGSAQNTMISLASSIESLQQQLDLNILGTILEGTPGYLDGGQQELVSGQIATQQRALAIWATGQMAAEQAKIDAINKKRIKAAKEEEDKINKANEKKKEAEELVRSNFEIWKALILKLDRYYNILKKIAFLEKQRTLYKLQEELATTTEGKKEALLNEYASLKNQERASRTLLEGKKEDLDYYQKNILPQYSEYLSVDKNGSIQQNYKAFADLANQIKNAKTKEQATALKEKYENLLSIMEDYNSTFESVLETEEKILGLTKEERDFLIARLNDINKLEDKIIEVLKANDQERVDNLEKTYNRLKELDNKYLDSVKKAIQKERDLRNKNKDLGDLQKKQNRLNLLKRDTSGIYASEILSLEEEIADEIQTISDNEIDRQIAAEEELLQKKVELWDEELAEERAILEQRATNLEYYGNIVTGLLALDQEELLAWFKANDEAFINGTTLDKNLWEIETTTTIATAQASMSLLNGQVDTLTSSNIALEDSIAPLLEDYKNLTENIDLYTEALQKIPPVVNTYVKVDIDPSLAQLTTTLQGLMNGAYDVAVPNSESYYTPPSSVITTPATSTTPTTPQTENSTDWISFNITKYRDMSNFFKTLQRWDGQPLTSGDIRAAMWYFNYDPLFEELRAKKENGFYFFKSGNLSFRTSVDNEYLGKKFSKGGLINYTGPAMVHGSESKPESILNPVQTSIFQSFVKELEYRPVPYNTSKLNNTSTLINGDSTYNISVNVANATTEGDRQKLIDKLKKEIVKASDNRSVTTINSRR